MKQRDLFQEIESYMNDKRGVLRDLFNEFDLDKNGALETHELGLLLKVNCADVITSLEYPQAANMLDMLRRPTNYMSPRLPKFTICCRGSNLAAAKQRCCTFPPW